jgi:hypothetical protein
MEQKVMDIIFIALTLWREARGEKPEVKYAISHVIKNRLDRKWGKQTTFMDICTAPWQFSGMSATGDPNLSKFPKAKDAIWGECIEIAESIWAVKDSDTSLLDPTNGAVFYHDKSIPKAPGAWGKVEETLVRGRIKFYKVKGEKKI